MRLDKRCWRRCSILMVPLHWKALKSHTNLDLLGLLGDPQEFYEWTSEVNKYRATIEEFISWSRIAIIEGATELFEIQENVDSPDEPPEDDDDEYLRGGDSDEYWTIARIFEDL